MYFRVELKNKPIKGDVMLYNGKEFECITLEKLVKEYMKEELKKIKDDIKLLKGEE